MAETTTIRTTCQDCGAPITVPVDAFWLCGECGGEDANGEEHP